MTLAERIVADVSTVFLNTNDFAEAVSYYASPAAEARSIVGDFQRRFPDVVDDAEGRNNRIQGTLCLPVSDANGAVSIAADGSDWFVIDGVKYRIAGASREAGAWTVELESMNYQTIRKAQKSTKR